MKMKNYKLSLKLKLQTLIKITTIFMLSTMKSWRRLKMFVHNTSPSMKSIWSIIRRSWKTWSDNKISGSQCLSSPRNSIMHVYMRSKQESKKTNKWKWLNLISWRTQSKNLYMLSNIINLQTWRMLRCQRSQTTISHRHMGYYRL